MQKFVRLFLPLLGLGTVWLGMSFLSPGTSGVLTTLFGLVSSAVIYLVCELWRERIRLAELEASRQLYKDSFERSNVGIAHTTEDGRWIRVNARFAEILGCRSEDLVGANIQDFTHPDDRAKDEELTRKVWCGELPASTVQQRFIRKDGTIAWVFLSATLTTARYGQPRSIIRSLPDIAAWKQAEAALTVPAVPRRPDTGAADRGGWRVYQDMADNFGDNPLEGFAAYRAALAGEPGGCWDRGSGGLGRRGVAVGRPGRRGGRPAPPARDRRRQARRARA